MSKHTPTVFLAPIAVILLAGVACESTIDPYQRPLYKQPLDKNAMHRYYEPMIHNAASSNMSIADGHFLPHTSELNSLGTRQLDRLVVKLEKYGGTVRYESHLKDEEMVNARMKSITEYLTDTGMVMSDVTVERKLPGGRILSARAAINARKKAYESHKSEASEAEGTSAK